MSFPYVLSKGFRRTQHADRHNSFDTLDFSPKHCNIKSCTCSSASQPKSVYVTVSLTVPQTLFLWHIVYYRLLESLCLLSTLSLRQRVNSLQADHEARELKLGI